MIDKLLISVDSEGQAGIVRNKIPRSESFFRKIYDKFIANNQSPTYIYGTAQGYENRLQMTLEATAAVECAVEAGVKDIVVRDAGFIRGVASSGLCLIQDKLPPGIRFTTGPTSIHEVAKEGFDAAVFLGMHSMAGTKSGVMAHTYSSVSIIEMCLNGEPVGEIYLEALQLGALNIPVIMVGGDADGCKEAKRFLGDDLATVVTKQGFSDHSAISNHPIDVCNSIKEILSEALIKPLPSLTTLLTDKLTLDVVCTSPKSAKSRAKRYGGKLQSPCSYRIITKSPLDLG